MGRMDTPHRHRALRRSFRPPRGQRRLVALACLCPRRTRAAWRRWLVAERARRGRSGNRPRPARTDVSASVVAAAACSSCRCSSCSARRVSIARSRGRGSPWVCAAPVSSACHWPWPNRSCDSPTITSLCCSSSIAPRASPKSWWMMPPGKKSINASGAFAGFSMKRWRSAARGTNAIARDSSSSDAGRAWSCRPAMRRASISPANCRPPADGNYTDIAAALKLALASFPDDTGKRIVLISDGNENLGNAEEQAPPRQTLGVQIDVLPLAAGQTNEDEVLVERVEAPPVIEQGARVPMRVLIRSHNPNRVIGRVDPQADHRGAEGAGDRRRGSSHLRRGLNVVTFTRPLTDEQRSYTYEAEFLPERRRGRKGRRGSTARAAGRPRAEQPRRDARRRARPAAHPDPGRQGRRSSLSRREAAARRRRAKFKIVAEPIALLDQLQGPRQVGRVPQQFRLRHPGQRRRRSGQRGAARSDPQQHARPGLRPGHDRRPGQLRRRRLAEHAGREGAAGRFATSNRSRCRARAAWCSSCTPPRWPTAICGKRRSPNSPSSGSARPTRSASSTSTSSTSGTSRLQEIGGNKAAILAQIDKMTPGDMPDFDPALQMAHNALTDPEEGAGDQARHHHQRRRPAVHAANPGGDEESDKMTVTTVGVACHGRHEDQRMAGIAKATGGRSYSVKDPRQLPAIYIKESRLVSQSFVHEKPFHAGTSRFAVARRSGCPIRCRRPAAASCAPRRRRSPLVRDSHADAALRRSGVSAPGLLALRPGQVGGVHQRRRRSEVLVARLDAGRRRTGGMYAKFWEQIIDWSLRPTESRRLNMTTEYRDGKIRIRRRRAHRRQASRTFT